MIFKIKGVVSFLLLLIALAVKTFAQGDGTLLVIPNLDSKIVLDGVDKGQTKAGSALRLTASSGEHYIEAQSLTGLTKGEVVQLEAGKQKIIKLDFETQTQTGSLEMIRVADINFEIPGFI